MGRLGGSERSEIGQRREVETLFKLKIMACKWVQACSCGFRPLSNCPIGVDCQVQVGSSRFKDIGGSRATYKQSCGVDYYVYVHVHVSSA